MSVRFLLCTLIVSIGLWAPDGYGYEPNFSSEEPFEVLGLEQGVSFDEAQRTYRDLVRKFSVDQNQRNGVDYTEVMKSINNAWDEIRPELLEAEATGKKEGFFLAPPKPPEKVVSSWIKTRQSKTEVLQGLKQEYSQLSSAQLLQIIQEGVSESYIDAAYDELVTRDRSTHLPEILKIVSGQLPSIARSPMVIFAKIEGQNERAILNFLKANSRYRFSLSYSTEVKHGLLFAQALIERLPRYPELIDHLLQLALVNYDELGVMSDYIIDSLAEYDSPEVARYLRKVAGYRNTEFYKERSRDNTRVLAAIIARQNQVDALEGASLQIQTQLAKLKKYSSYSSDQVAYSPIIYQLNVEKAERIIAILLQGLSGNNHPVVLEALAMTARASFLDSLPVARLRKLIDEAVEQRSDLPQMHDYLNESAFNRICRRLLGKAFWNKTKNNEEDTLQIESSLHE